MFRMKSGLIIAFSTIIVWAGQANANLLNVTLTDLDGPQIVGQVDTLADIFTVTSWTEGASGFTTWTPTSGFIPLTYTARTSSGAVYDVPDLWDGLIDSTWAFISDLSNNEIDWNDGNYTEANRHHGWGGGIDSTGSIAVSFSFSNQNNWQWAPTGAISVSTMTFDTVSIVAAEVPAPATLALIGLGLGCLGWSRRKQA